MNTKNVIGKRIVKIHQFRPGRAANVPNVVAVSAIELEDGTQLRPSVVEGEAGYFVELIIVSRALPIPAAETPPVSEADPAVGVKLPAALA